VGATGKGGKRRSRLSQVWITGTDTISCLTFVQDQYFLPMNYKLFLVTMPKFLRNEKGN